MKLGTGEEIGHRGRGKGCREFGRRGEIPDGEAFRGRSGDRVLVRGGIQRGVRVGDGARKGHSRDEEGKLVGVRRGTVGRFSGTRGAEFVRASVRGVVSRG